MRVIDIMTTEMVVAVPGDSLKVAARRMVQNRVSGLPVVDEAGFLKGIVTEADFLRRQVEKGQDQPKHLLGVLFGGEEPHDEAVTVGEVMATDVATVSPDLSLSEAARMMANRGIKRLPVVDGEGRLLGIVSRADIVKAFTRPDEVIEDEIREDIARRVLFLDPDSLRVAVDEGVVTLSGEVPTRVEARMLQELSRRLDGVVAVESQLTYRVDERGLEAL